MSRRFLIFGFLGLLLVLGEVTLVLKPVRQVAELPIVAVKERIYGIRRLVGILSVWRVKEDDLDNLRADVARLNSLSAEVATLSAENVVLKTQLGVRTVPAGRLLMARPLGNSNGLMTINAGSSDGVGVGDSVVLGQVLVGKVASITPHQATVRLPIYENEKIAVVARGETDGVRRAAGVLVGQGDRLILDKVVLSDSLEIGDLIMTVGEGYERDLVVGKVAEVITREDQLFKKARVETAVDYSRLERVFVLIK